MRRRTRAGTLVLALSLLASSPRPAAAWGPQPEDLGSFFELPLIFTSRLHSWISHSHAAGPPPMSLLEDDRFSSLPPLSSPQLAPAGASAPVAAPAAAPGVDHRSFVYEEEEGLMPGEADAGNTNLITYQIKRPGRPKAEPLRKPMAALLKKKKELASTKRAYEQWQMERSSGHDGARRSLAQAPSAGLTAFSANDKCESVTCGGKCCDSLYTYSTTGNTTCTEPETTCSASNECQLKVPEDAEGCDGMVMTVYPYPADGPARADPLMFGYTCPSDGNQQCGFLNTYASDLSLCTEGACITDAGGNMGCAPITRGTDSFGCTAAIFAYTFPGQGIPTMPPTSSTPARQGVRVSNDITVAAGQQATPAG